MIKWSVKTKFLHMVNHAVTPETHCISWFFSKSSFHESWKYPLSLSPLSTLEELGKLTYLREREGLRGVWSCTGTHTEQEFPKVVWSDSSLFMKFPSCEKKDCSWCQIKENRKGRCSESHSSWCDQTWTLRGASLVSETLISHSKNSGVDL